MRNGRYLDFLDILLTAKDADGQGLTEQEIRAEVDTFLFEGEDVSLTCWLRKSEEEGRVVERSVIVMIMMMLMIKTTTTQCIILEFIKLMTNVLFYIRLGAPVLVQGIPI